MGRFPTRPDLGEPELSPTEVEPLVARRVRGRVHGDLRREEEEVESTSCPASPIGVSSLGEAMEPEW